MSRRVLLVLAALIGLVVPLHGGTAGGSTGSGEAALTGVTQLDVGGSHACAVLTSGQVRCWGDNTFGQLGTGDTDARRRPAVVRNGNDSGPLTGVVEVDAGNEFTCARLTNRQVRCWGHNDAGQHGRGSVGGQSELPVTVLAVSGAGALGGAADLETGLSHACVRLTSQEARCWGDNSGGQLGDDSFGTRSRPVPVTGLSGGTTRLTGVTSLGLGSYHSCARLASGQARCWGYNNVGQLGNNNTIQTPRPVAVQNTTGTGRLSGVRSVDAAQSHTCAVVTGGTALCWGGDTFLQLGNGALGQAFLPAPVRNLADTGTLAGVTQIDTESLHVCVRLNTGQARCWGRNTFGQLGAGNLDAPDVPVAVRRVSGAGNLTDVGAVSAGTVGSCARLTNGQARCWGFPLGNGTPDVGNRPVVVG